jgi:hypothetical protein
MSKMVAVLVAGMALSRSSNSERSQAPVLARWQSTLGQVCKPLSLLLWFLHFADLIRGGIVHNV